MEKKWDVTGTVGSAGTETNGFQLLKDSTVVIKNGLIMSSTAKILFQNYANLTFDNIEATLTTPGSGHYVASNNNGKTTLRSSTLRAPEKGFALDSYSFADYVGGDVFVDDLSSLVGNVEVANGGKLTVEGYVTGNIRVFNDDTAGHKDRTPVLTVRGGDVYGNILAENNGQVVLDGCGVEGVDTKGDAAKATIKAGWYLHIGENVEIDNADVAVIETKDGKKVYAVGAQGIDGLIKITGPKETLAKVTVLSAADGKSYDIPEGVVVDNKTDKDIKVNGKVLAKGDSVKVEGTSKPDPDKKPEQKPEQKPDPDKKPEPDKKPAPQTGDANSMIPLAVMVMAAGAMAVVYRKKNN